MNCRKCSTVPTFSRALVQAVKVCKSFANLGCSVAEKLAGRSHPEGSGKWLNAQMEISDKWCPLRGPY